MVYLELFWSFVKIGFTSFGGISMIPLINHEMVGHGWMTLEEVADIVAIAEMTPGPLGLNCATFAGMRVAGLPGSLVTVFGVLSPTFTVCLAAAIAFEKFKNSKFLTNLLTGIRPMCLGMIASVILSQAISNYTDAGSPVWPAVFIGVLGIILLDRFKFTVPKLIVLSAALGLVLVR